MRANERLVFTVAITLAGCSAIIGANDLDYVPGAPGAPDSASTDGASNDGSSSGADGTVDAPPDATMCSKNLDEDPKNCGRCGRDCLGDPCKMGRCEPTIIAQGLAVPSAIALDATFFYVATFGDGRIQSFPKGGGAGPVLDVNVNGASAVAIAGTTMVYGGDSSSSPLRKCTLPACTDPVQLSQVGSIQQVAIGGNYAYVTTNSDIRRIDLAGGGTDFVIDTIPRLWGVAADASHVYYNGLTFNIYRKGSAGGTRETVAAKPLDNADTLLAVDADRMYYAAYGSDGKGIVESVAKANFTQTVRYTAVGKRSMGVAVDDKYVYWLDEGTLDGGGMTNSDGSLYACPKAGCGPAPILLATDGKRGGPIVTDATHVYWVEFGSPQAAIGRVRRVAKP